MAQRNEDRALRPVEPTNLTQVNDLEFEILEKVAIGGDLAQLQPKERMSYYLAMCRMAGVSPVNRPFEYLTLDKKLTLYASRRATDEIRSNRGITIKISESREAGDVWIATAVATLPDGRTDEATGIVPIMKEEITGWENNRPIKSGAWLPLNPVEKANAIMKAETKAKRRVTLSAVGLGMTDESEVETIRNATRVNVNHETGEILDQMPGVTTVAFESKDEVNKAAHAFIDSVGGNHSDLHNLMVALFKGKFESLKELSIAQYANFLDRLKDAHARNPQQFDQWMTSLQQQPEAIVDIDTQPTANADTARTIKRIRGYAKKYGWQDGVLEYFAETVGGGPLDQLEGDQLTTFSARVAALDDMEQESVRENYELASRTEQTGLPA